MSDEIYTGPSDVKLDKFLKDSLPVELNMRAIQGVRYLLPSDHERDMLREYEAAAKGDDQAFRDVLDWG